MGLCDWKASAQAIPEPWSENTRAYANDAIRIARLDTIEPAAAAEHLLVMTPKRTDMGERTCRIVSLSKDYGFAALDMSDVTAEYDASTGLELTLGVDEYDPETSRPVRKSLGVVINQATGGVTATLSAVAQ